jgi:voltage-gated potassium channel
VREMKRIWNEILTFLALLFLTAFSYPAFVSEVSTEAQRNIDLIQWISWSAFVVDIGFGLMRSDNRRKYLWQHPLEVASVLLPFLRPLRLLRVISFAGLAIQKVAIGRQFTITIKVALTALFVAYISAIQITIIERSANGSNIKTFEDGLWWAITTVTTVGYGDRFPTTNEGRALAVLLMITGISLIGVITASVASWFVRMSTNEATKPQQ